ncbi:MAG: hypothetical protein Q4B03_10410 [Lachnospiraceae bacterium]|nr:hypothetical protein [Lachnospiraceae bacterium]
MEFERAILAEYEQKKEIYKDLENYVAGILTDMMKKDNVMLMELTHRLKTSESLAAKVIKKDKYRVLTDITDVVGCRLVAYFADDVDQIAAMVSRRFQMDWGNTVDKSAALSPTAFGYTSLHYVCSLPEEGEFTDYPAEFRGIRFEIQIRTALQHVWAEIEHDLGYKSEFGVPRSIRREFSRIAGLLEIADERFNAIRTSVGDYTLEIRDMIKNDLATDLLVDQVSLKEYMYRNVRMQDLINQIARECDICVEHVDPFPYLKALEYLNIVTLGDLSAVMERNWNAILSYARELLTDTDMDLISSNAILRFICYSELICGGYSEKRIVQFMSYASTNKERARQNAKALLAQKELFTGKITNE